MLQAVAKIKDLDIKVIGPSHGPRAAACALRDRTTLRNVVVPIFCKPTARRKSTSGMCPATATRGMLAERIAFVVKGAGLDVEVEDVSTVPPTSCAAKIHAADAFAIGSPTINRDALKPVWDVLTSISTYVVKGKPRCSVRFVRLER